MAKVPNEPRIDLEDFERRIVIRQLTLDDYDALVTMEGRCFPEEKQGDLWTREHIESQVRIFPEGQVCIEVDGELAASSSSLILDYEPNLAWHDWVQIADDGFIRNHKPDGDTLYGIEMMVDPRFQGMKLARRLYDARKELCRRKNLARMMIGGRIPGYGEHADEMSAREYVDNVVDKTFYDPVLTMQLAAGFALQALIPDYLPADTASRGYATSLEWRNLEYRRGAKRRYHHPVEPIRLAAVQYKLRPLNDFDEFARQCEFFVDTASEYKCDFVLFPELLTTQLLSFRPPARPGAAARALHDFTPQYLELFTDLAVRYDVNIVGGSHFVVEKDELRNISYLFRRDGTHGKQYKIHITPSERKWWGVAPGERAEVFDTDCGRIAIMVCYDIEFPELVRVAAHKGAQIIFVPFNTDTRHGYLRIRNCALARCVENHLYVAVAGCTGNLPFVENSDIHYAQSAVFTPADTEFARDAIAAECTPNIETMVIHDVDLELLRRHRQSGDVQNWNDRRRDLYKVVYTEDGAEHEI